MSEDINANINSTQCLKTISDFGKETVINICSGKTTIMEWGSADWFWMCFGIVAATALVGLLIAVLFGFVKMLLDPI